MTPPDPHGLHEGEEAPPPGVRTMAVVRWALVALMALAAAGGAAAYFGLSFGRHAAHGEQLYYCPMHPQIVQDRPGDCPICSMTLVPKPPGAVKPSATMQAAPADAGIAGKYWCPMHPHVTSDDPSATCALCGGMKLVPRPAASAGGTSDAGVVPGLVPIELGADRVQRIGIRTAVVTRGPLVSVLRTVGAVEPNERGLAQITPRFSGFIEELFVNETGQTVKRGQALCTIYSPEILQAQQELLSALGWSTGSPAPGQPHHGAVAPAEGLVADARHRLELLGISPQEIDAIVTTRQPRRAIALRSPVQGHVIAKNAVVGMSVAAGTPLFQVADLSTVWVLADVYEGDVQHVRVGQPARFAAASYPGQLWKGRVQFIHPTMDPGSRTLRLRLEVRNPDNPRGPRLRPGMYGDVVLDLPARTGLLLPAEALVDTGDVQFVFVAREGGRFEPRRVKLGSRTGEHWEVLAGLNDGERVVTSANFLVDSESRLRAAIEGATP